MSRTNDVTADVLLRRCGELRKQRDAAVQDNQRLRRLVAVLRGKVTFELDLPAFLRPQAQ